MPEIKIDADALASGEWAHFITVGDGGEHVAPDDRAVFRNNEWRVYFSDMDEARATVGIEEPTDEDEPEEPKLPFWTVAIYLVGLSCGGSEEGGWWYQSGRPLDLKLIALSFWITARAKWEHRGRKF